MTLQKAVSEYVRIIPSYFFLLFLALSYRPAQLFCLNQMVTMDV